LKHSLALNITIKKIVKETNLEKMLYCEKLNYNMKNSILTIIALFIAAQGIAQDIPAINFDQTNDINFYKAISNNTTVGEYVASDNSIFKVGDEIILGAPSNPSGFDTDFKYIQLGKISAGMGALMSMGNVETPMVPESFEGRNAIIDKIKVFHKGNKKKPLYVVLELAEPNGNAFVTLTKRLSVMDTEFALKYGEIINPNAPLNREQAITKLKEAKELLELDMMSQEEYDALKAELTPIIRGN
jgi:hypothetical protein